jgi:hypothetical protein
LLTLTKQALHTLVVKRKLVVGHLVLSWLTGFLDKNQSTREARSLSSHLSLKVQKIPDVISWERRELRFTKYRRSVPYRSIQFADAEKMLPSLAVQFHTVPFHRIAVFIAASG